MRRRPLASSVADWVVPWRERDWPIDWDAELGRGAPLALEIGFGNGEFLAREAERRPERNHVGIDVSWTSLTYLLRRLDRGGAAHVRALLARAESALALLFAPGSLCEVFVNHPCPWPKERHHRRRLISDETLALIASRMAPGALLSIRTDHAEYAAWIAAALEREPALEPAPELVHASDDEHAPRSDEPTKYQRKAMAAGVPIHYFSWRKAREPVRLPPVPLFDPLSSMPSLTLRGSVPDTGLFEGFAPLVRVEEQDGVETVVKLIAAFRREGPAGSPSWLVHTLIKEGDLQQELALEAAAREGGRLVVRPSSLGYPHPTTGVKRAVWHLGAWIAQRHPELKIASHSLGERAAMAADAARAREAQRAHQAHPHQEGAD